MGRIVGPDGKEIEQALSEEAKPFAELLNTPEDMHRVFFTIRAAIMHSFAVDAQRDGKVPTITQNELKHRFKICEAFFRHCRGDLGYSLEKTLDLMARALRSELDGVSFDPGSDSNTNLWTPSG